MPIDESPPDDDELDELDGVHGPEEPVDGAPGIDDDEPPVELDGEEEPLPVFGAPAPPLLPPVLGKPVPLVPPPVFGMPVLPPVLGMPELLPEPLLELLPELLPELPPELGEPALPELPELGEPALPESFPQPLTMSAVPMANASSAGRTRRPVTVKEPTLNAFISFYLVCRRSNPTPPRGRRLR